jgi:hypothetical protein
LLDYPIFSADEAWGDKLPAIVLDGYHLWAQPIVNRMRRDPMYARKVAAIAQPIVRTMASFMGAGAPTVVGLVALAIGLPACAVLGLGIRAARLVAHGIDAVRA